MLNVTIQNNMAVPQRQPLPVFVSTQPKVPLCGLMSDLLWHPDRCLWPLTSSLQLHHHVGCNSFHRNLNWKKKWMTECITKANTASVFCKRTPCYLARLVFITRQSWFTLKDVFQQAYNGHHCSITLDVVNRSSAFSCLLKFVIHAFWISQNFFGGKTK